MTYIVRNSTKDDKETVKKIFDEVLEEKGENEMETMLDVLTREAVEKTKKESAVKIAKQMVLLDFSLKDITAAAENSSNSLDIVRLCRYNTRVKIMKAVEEVSLWQYLREKLPKPEEIRGELPHMCFPRLLWLSARDAMRKNYRITFVWSADTIRTKKS